VLDDNSREVPAMNGVHDMGGMDGFGPILIEQNEPVFHADWEKRMYAIAMSLARNADEFRHAIERIPAPIYLDSSYYERWLNGMMTLLVEKNRVTREELVARGAAPVAPAQPPNQFRGNSPAVRRRRPRFREGDRVIARNINPTGHTRLPRYVRGKRGVIHRDWGAYVFADSNAHNGGDRVQHVYSVTFEARELWGKDAPRHDTLRIDLWEDYLDADSIKAAKKKARAITRAGRGKKR
jgi:nitrile hydratase beta subunit